MPVKIIEAKLALTAEDKVTAVFNKMAADVKKATDVINAATQFERQTRGVQQVTEALEKVAAVQKRVAQDTHLSDVLARDLQAMRLTNREMGTLSREATRMLAEREKALAGINNAKVRDQVVAQDRAAMEQRIRIQAQGLAAQRAAEEAFAKQMGAISKAEAAERKRAAQEAARAAREAEREATRAADQGARERAAIARREATAEAAAWRRREREQHAYDHRMSHLGRDVIVGAGLGYGAHRVGHALKEGAQQGRLAATEDVKEQFQGFTPEQIAETRRRAMDLSARFPSVSALKIREYQRKATAVTGDFHHAEDLMEDMVRARVMLGVGGKGEEGEHDVETIVQASEGLNRASSAAVLRPMLNAFVKAKALYGETVRADTFRDYTKQAGTSVVGLDDSYLTRVVPSMLQENAQWGVAQMTALGQMSRPVQKRPQIKALNEAGLLDNHHMLVGRTLARKNPYEYANTVLADALRRKGIDLDKARDFTDPEGQAQRLAIGDKLASWFPDRKASLFWEKQILDKTKIDRNMKQGERAVGLEGAETALRQDPGTGLEALKSQVENFASVASGPLVKAAAPALADLASGIARFTQTLEKHPEETKKGVAAAAVVGGATLPFIVGHSMKALAGEGTGIAANALRLGGGALTGLGLPMLALGTAGAFAGYATGQEYEKTYKARGPGGFDPATGSTTDANPMAGLGPDHPWVREAITGWWSKTMPTWAGGGEEAGRQIGESVGKGIVSAPLPPRRPAMLDDFQQKADETGSTAGKSIIQRLMEAVSVGIEVPIRFVPGESGASGEGGGSGLQKASFDGGGLGGMIRKASLGGGGNLGGGVVVRGGSGSGGGGSALAIPPSVQASDGERNTLGLIQRYESGGRNIPNYRYDRGHTAQGYYQITNTNWRNIAPKLGITAPNAMSASHADQARVALYLLRGSGIGNWTPKVARALRRGEQAQFGVGDSPVVRRAADSEPHLVRGLDGKEGLDLGNGTMRMPDGAIRSIPSGPPRMPDRTVPDAPRVGLGGGSDAMQAAADRMHAAAERMEQMTVRTHHTFEVNAAPGLTARAKKMRRYDDGPVRGNLGLSMPGAEGGTIT